MLTKSKKEIFAYYILYSTITLLVLTGILSPFKYNLAPSNLILELVLIASSILLISPPNKYIFPYFVVASLYTTISFSLMRIYNPSNALDFAQAYKAFFYIIPLTFFLNRNLFTSDQSNNLTKLLLLAFLFKYTYSRLLNIDPVMGARPGLFSENNFELIFLIIIFYVNRNGLTKGFPLWLPMLILIVLMSGSRSSLLALLVVFCSMYLTKVNYKTLLYFTIFLLLGAAVYSIFMERMTGNIESIDRYRFFLIFVNEISSWSFYNYILGTFPITPLSSYACTQLSYYDSLFSFSGTGQCYSVILHSYIFRVIFDHGVIGLIFLCVFIYKILILNKRTRKESLTVLAVLLISALSVSAMNSIYTALAIALTISTRKVNY